MNTTVHIAKRLASSGGGGIDLVLHPGDLSYALPSIPPVASPHLTSLGATWQVRDRI